MAFNETPTYDSSIAGGDVGSPNLFRFLSPNRAAFASRPAQGNKGAFFISSNGKAADGLGEALYFDDGSDWVFLGYVVGDGAQTWAGVKTFSSIPVLPASNPTTDNQAARKAYVDTKIAGEVVIKAADETVNNSTTLQNDDELVLAVEANKTYSLTAMFLGTTADASANIKIGWSVPTSATMSWGLGAGDVVEKVETDTAVLTLSLNTREVFFLHGVLIVGANAGNLQLQWAQDSAQVADTKMLIGSWLQLAEG